MEPIPAASMMQRLVAWMDISCRPTGLIQHRFDGAPFGTTYLCIAPDEQGVYASSNHNRVHVCGTNGGLSADGMAHFIKLFREAGVTRFFAWLGPGPQMDLVRGWLTEAGLSRISHVDYLTLARDAREPSAVVTDLTIRELAAEEVAGFSERLDGIAWPEYVRSAGATGFSHFMAFDGDQPVASAVLCVFEGLGYLCMALTAEAARGRGAQRALIARRIEKARTLGCSTLVSETLSILPISLGNLRKAGFQPVYEREVFSGHTSD
jgi:GNAT superfamily N-acetyltransferase